jgi:hypothetical protein
VSFVCEKRRCSAVTFYLAIRSFLSKRSTVRGDQGHYMCVSHSHNQSEEFLLVDVQLAEPPRVASSWQSHDVEAGSRVEIVIQDVVGSPPPKVRFPSPLTSRVASVSPGLQYNWRLNGIDFASTSEPALVLSNVTREVSGTFTCKVWNVAGVAIWEVRPLLSSPPKTHTISLSLSLSLLLPALCMSGSHGDCAGFLLVTCAAPPFTP